MGGSLAVTIRLSDGTEYRMERWTNSLPHSIHDLGFLAEKPEAIDEYLNPWREMKADWEKNKDSGKFEHNMTAAYAPYPYGLKPSEYGAVVICFKTGTLLTLQGYTAIGSRHWLGLDFGLHDQNDSDADMIQAFQEAGRILGYKTHASDPQVLNAVQVALPGTTMIDIPQNPASTTKRLMIPGSYSTSAVKSAVRKIQHQYGPQSDRTFRFSSAIFDMAPFTVETFSEGADGYRAMLARIEEIGFELSDEERAGWQERIAEIEEEDGE